MERLVIVGDAIVVLVEGTALGVDQDRAKGAVPIVECGLGQFDAATQTLQIDLAHTHRAEVYGRCLAARPPPSHQHQAPTATLFSKTSHMRYQRRA